MKTNIIKRIIIIAIVAALPLSSMVSIVAAATYSNAWYLIITALSLVAMHGIIVLDRKNNALLLRLTR
jgi:hypothetical protein